MGMGTICHTRPVDKDQNVSSGDAEQTWPPAEGARRDGGRDRVRRAELRARPPRPEAAAPRGARPVARRGGQGVGRDAREAGLRGDLRGGVPRLEARVCRKVDFGGYGGNPSETENGCPHNGPFCAGFEEGSQRLAEAARNTGAHISIGFSERDAVNGTLYNSNAIFEPDGSCKVHR